MIGKTCKLFDEDSEDYVVDVVEQFLYGSGYISHGICYTNATLIDDEEFAIYNTNVQKAKDSLMDVIQRAIMLGFEMHVKNGEFIVRWVGNNDYQINWFISFEMTGYQFKDFQELVKTIELVEKQQSKQQTNKIRRNALRKLTSEEREALGV